MCNKLFCDEMELNPGLRRYRSLTPDEIGRAKHEHHKNKKNRNDEFIVVKDPPKFSGKTNDTNVRLKVKGSRVYQPVQE